MTTDDLLGFLRGHVLAVQSSVSSAGGPQAAVVGLVVTDALEIFFDTDSASRKVSNLRRNPAIALVVGGTTPGDERTVQYEGLADEPAGAELEQLKELYFDVLPAGREREAWHGITYIPCGPPGFATSTSTRILPKSSSSIRPNSEVRTDLG